MLVVTAPVAILAVIVVYFGKENRPESVTLRVPLNMPA